MDKKKANIIKLGIYIAIGLIIINFIVPSVAYVDDSYTGEFIVANKVYLSDGSLNIVVYFNETPNTHYLIFESWDAKHSVQLSNLVEGDRVKIWYRDFTFGVRTIVEIEKYD